MGSQRLRGAAWSLSGKRASGMQERLAPLACRSSSRQHEPCRDQPDEPRKACQRNEEEGLWKHEIEPAQLSHDRQNQAEQHQPPGQQLPESCRNRDPSQEQPHGNGKSRTSDRRLSQLNSPTIARTKPNSTSHRGNNFQNPAGIETPARSSPMGTENPGPQIGD